MIISMLREYFLFHPPFFLSVSAAFGLVVGSFLNVVIHRLPIMRQKKDPAGPEVYNLAFPASACPSCGHVIRWYENIPVLSWLVLKGRCSGCDATISPRYAVIELLTGVAFLLAALVIGPELTTLAAMWVAACLIASTCLYLETRSLYAEMVAWTWWSIWMLILCFMIIE